MPNLLKFSRRDHETPDMALPAMDRRRLLGGLAAASAGAAGASILTLAEAAPAIAAPLENPELVRLGDAFPAVGAEYLNAKQHRQNVINEWWWKWPVAPSFMAASWEDHSRWERSFTGAAILADGSYYDVPSGSEYYGVNAKPFPKPRTLRTASHYAEAVEDLRKAMRRKRKNPFAPFGVFYLGYQRKLTVDQCEAALAEVTDLHAKALAYEAEKQRVLQASGWEAADARFKAAEAALGDTVAAIMAQAESTMAGIVIKAQALAFWGRLDPLTRMGIGGGALSVTQWEAQFAASVLRIASQQPSA
jgi:hypothetical protein